MVIGVTGSLCSGKSAVVKLLKAKGAGVFDADKVVHKYYRDKKSAVYKKVAALFPGALQKRKICRKRLGAIVFADRQKLHKLEEAVHPAVIKELLAWIAKAKGRNKVYVAEVPLLFEKKLQGHFDKIVLVTAKKDALLKRIAEKYHFSLTEALKRLALYMPVKEKIKNTDFVIDNSSEFNKLKKEVCLLWKKIKQNQK